MPGIEAALADLVKLHPPDSCSCGGKGHGFWTVKRVLRDLAEAPKGVRLKGVDWMYPLWRYTSRIDHHAGFERMLRFDGDRRWIGPAEPWQRVQTFIWSLQVYGSVVGWIAEEFDRSVAEELVKELALLSNHEALLAVARENPKAFTLGDA